MEPISDAPVGEGENGLPDILGCEVPTNGKSKEVDHLIDMRSYEMGAENAPAALLDQCFVAVHGFADPAGRVPVRDFVAIDPKHKPCRPRSDFAHADRGDRRQCESDAPV